MNQNYHTNFFNFKRFRDSILITNDAGEYMFITESDFYSLINGEELSDVVYKGLIDKHFIFTCNDEVFINEFKSCIKGNKRYLYGGTSLHIFVLNNTCNMRCVYCQAKDEETVVSCFMDKKTAEKSVDIALSSPARFLSFEFQGGEPLLNYDVLKHIVEYAEQNKGGKNIRYNLVTNLTMMTEKMEDFFIQNGVSICTSLDGPKELHNYNRPFLNGQGSYDEVKNKVKALSQRGISFSAIQTTTKKSLAFAKEIVDEYISFGQRDLFIRPLTRLGTADVVWDTVGYSAEEFLNFYRDCLDYIIKLNIKDGLFVREKHAVLFLRKIILGVSDNYMELRSPCGASIGQMAYYADGNVFSCDEGRMLYEMGDDSFKLGNVYDNTYDDLVQSPVSKTMCIASLLEGQVTCCDCVYQPYCGTCPVINLAQENDVFVHNAESFRCKIYRGMLEYLFELIYENDEEIIRVLYNWVSEKGI